MTSAGKARSLPVHLVRTKTPRPLCATVVPYGTSDDGSSQ
jgi:hypothetical protein